MGGVLQVPAGCGVTVCVLLVHLQTDCTKKISQIAEQSASQCTSPAPPSLPTRIPSFPPLHSRKWIPHITMVPTLLLTKGTYLLLLSQVMSQLMQITFILQICFSAPVINLNPIQVFIPCLISSIVAVWRPCPCPLM
jgi:hypothetical protein